MDLPVLVVWQVHTRPRKGGWKMKACLVMTVAGTEKSAHVVSRDAQEGRCNKSLTLVFCKKC